jgi:primosomal protein N' (replication factor Y)
LSRRRKSLESEPSLFPDLLKEEPPKVYRTDLLVADVAPSAPIHHLLTYLVPEHLQERVAVGLRVRVPLSGRQVPGVVVAVRFATQEEQDSPKKPIAAVLESEPSLTPLTLELGLWVASYYGAAPGEALFALVPAAVRKGRQVRGVTVYRIADREKAAHYLNDCAAKRSLKARAAVLKTLLHRDAEAHYTGEDLQKLAGVGLSPLKSLCAMGLIERTQIDPTEPTASDAGDMSNVAPTPTSEQQVALDRMLPLMAKNETHRILLHGVTGSGKTEVYLRLMEEALSKGRTAILLIPEISLTPQTVGRIRARIADVAVLHSRLSEGERADEWRRLREGRARVAIGPRSAIFAPLHNLGLIIIDEEHESTFKQQQSPRYHARDVAKKRAELEGALLVLGTATPSLESEGLVEAGLMERIPLLHRVANRPMPPISIIDMRHEKPIGPQGIFSRPLLMALDHTLSRGGQAMLFLNRRGYATSVLCRRCGWRATCEHCAITLTHYRDAAHLLCHYCGTERTPPTECPDCLAPDIRFAGFGTERVARAVADLYPERRVARMDGETLRKRGAAESIFNDLKSGAIDILVGTQVLAKGLDIPNITLVGVISADTALLIPDFRSSERTFQLLCQVAGRAGRGDLPGQVIVQTFSPTHPAIMCASRHDHGSFAREELKERRALAYPPYGSMARIVLESEDPALALEAAQDLANHCGSFPEVKGGRATVLGPAPCPIALINGFHRFHLLFSARDADTITGLLPRLQRATSGKVKAILDRDPVALL